jgi:hypothetical protein
MAARELQDRAASGREPEHHGSIDTEMVEQQLVRIGLVSRGSPGGQP